ncbi:ROK family transcriptional regulator [Nonomuraea sp. PA05]|uniref:ROK family transcriptional regulator n=1 Tax=Nonomuraea sp. PA05 TaxID=2604466 RepID=UPI0011DC6550|nr:ROK family transcriptional regulator [Nonomuraea sp. PA05]TYB64221.1 ROK family transcriptional regulator [Nonomuraea sp. PA05]
MAGTDRGDLTRTAILALLGTVGPLSRTEIARELDLSPATVTQLTKELIGHGMLEELDLKPSRGGRPAQRLGLVGSAGRALGVKVTADHLVLVDVRLDGEVLGSWERPHDPAAPDALEQLADAVESVVREISGVPPLLGVGVGVPGSVDDQAVGTVNAPTLGWQAMPVGERLRRRLNLPVLVENDVNALAAAERLYGRGRTHSDFLVVTIGRGVGAAIVADGRVYRGARGGAGEFGHLPVDPEGPACGCGARGCLEAFVGSAGLLAAARARQSAAQGDGRTHAGRTDARRSEEERAHMDARRSEKEQAHMDARDTGARGLDARDPLGAVAALGRAAAGGDGAAREVFAEAGAILGRATAGLINVVDPEVVVVLGEGTADWPLWRTGFEPALRAQLYPGRRDISVEVESWDDTSWAQGAAALVLATPFDSAGAAGEQGRLVRARLIGATT